MQGRCNRSTDQRYSRYGARGIAVCSEWENSYVAFRDWALANGYEDGLEIDRIDNDGPYSPENCRWTTHSENIRNSTVVRAVTAFGETKSIAEWAEDSRCAVRYGTLVGRLAKGWSPEDAIALPVQKAWGKVKHDHPEAISAPMLLLGYPQWSRRKKR
jgi:hypothetical protein